MYSYLILCLYFFRQELHRLSKSLSFKMRFLDKGAGFEAKRLGKSPSPRSQINFARYIKSVYCIETTLFLTIKQNNMKRLTLLAAAFIVLMASCNNNNNTDEKANGEKPAEAPKKATSMAPFKAMIVQHTVKDYDAWYKVFAAGDSMRKASGLNHFSVGRGIDNDKSVVVFNVAEDLQKARDFAASPGLKDAMKKAGVTGKPDIIYLDVLYDDTTHIPQHERLMVTHHVRDFDAWKKVFDAEGDSVRAANGMIKRGLARGADDPNTVSLLFAVTDMAKAKARVASADLKKIMTDAGVDGPPAIAWFKWVAHN
jgi:quinol monooxygenase YgiN